MTCATTGPVVDAGSLYEYCRKRYPRLAIGEDDPVAIVSFPGLRHPVPVPAKLLRLRIMADRELSFHGLGERKGISPEGRRAAAEDAWAACRDAVQRLLGLRLEDQLWSPPAESRELLPCPTLLFAKGRSVAPPRRRTPRSTADTTARGSTACGAAGSFATRRPWSGGFTW